MAYLDPTTNGEVKEMAFTQEEHMGCHLQAIGGVGPTLTMASGRAQLEKLLERNHGMGNGYKGQYFTASIVSIRAENAADRAVLEELGFKLLGIQQGAHGTYKMALYGKGFELPESKTSVPKWGWGK